MCSQRSYLLFWLTYLVMNHAVYNQGEDIQASIAKQEWGHIEIRPGAHMFWWLYQTTANVTDYTDRPLIIWLQGGPGLGSSCVGNFLEIGPVDANLEQRNHSWTEEFNVLFLDNPVNVGLSYRSSPNVTIAHDVKEVGKDLVRFLTIFLEKFPMLQEVPLYIFGESYGGKFAVDFASRLQEEISSERITAKLVGVGIMSGSISPMDLVDSYGRFASALGLLDNNQYAKYRKLKRSIKLAVHEHRQAEASSLMSSMLVDVFAGHDIYNIIEKTTPSSRNLSTSIFENWHECHSLYSETIQPQMNMTNNGNWSYLNDDVNGILRGDYLVPVTDRIEYLLEHTNVRIMVFSGMFDLITNVGGTVSWMNKLRWSGAKNWKKTIQQIVEIDGVNEAYVRKTDKLLHYIVTQAGHAIPSDNPKAMLEILRREILQENYV